ncbi:MAG: hypothetical protein QXT96_05655, partial [Candidatus Bathyarchaeia archaeon]
MHIRELKSIVLDEVVQRREEGYDTREVEEWLSRVKEPSTSDLERVLRDLEVCPLTSDFPYVEPLDFAGIVAER